MTDTAAAPATTAAGDNSSPDTASQGFDVDASDDQIIADLRATALASKANDNAGEADEGDSSDEAGEKTQAEKPKGEKAKPDTSKQTKALPYETAQAAIDAVVKAFETGDTKELAKATGKPENFFQVNDAKWAAFREQTADLKKGQKELQSGQAKLADGIKAAKEEFGKAILAAKAYREGDLSQFVTLVTELAGEDYDEAQRKVIQGELAADPATKAMRQRLAQLEAKEKARELAARQSEKTQEEQLKAAYQSSVKRIESELAGHAVSKVKGFQDLILNRIRDSWSADDQAYTMSVQEAADAVVADRAAEAEALGFTRKQAEEPRKVTSSTPSVPPRNRGADARPPDGDPWLTKDMDDDEIIASIHRDIKSGRLK